MKFKFRLEKTAQFFSQKETAKKLELAAVVTQVNQLKNEMEKIEEESRNLMGQKSNPQTISASWIQVWMDRLEANVGAIERVRKEMELVLVQLEHKKSELMAISMRKKALEKVKEKKLSEFRMLKTRSEQKKLDENYQILELTKT